MRRWAVALLVAGAMGAGAPEAQVYETIDHAEEYRACMTLARRTPEDALESATAWESRGGGHAAQHCSAVALSRASSGVRRARVMQARDSSAWSMVS